MRRSAAVAAAAFLACFALAAAGCGGDDESASASAPDEWAAGFCTAVSTWTDELQTIGDDITNPSSLNADALQDAAGDVSSATDAFVEDVRALGAPDTESGEEVRSSLETLADTVETEKTNIEQAADDVSGLTGLASAVSAIGTSLTAMGTAFETALEAIENADVGGELKTALEDSDDCAELTG